MKKAGHDAALMQYADGELATEPTDADGRTKVEAVRELGELVRGNLEHAADAVHDARFAAMWRRIDEQLEVPAQRTVWGRVSAWIDRYRGYVITGAVSAGAVAALALVLRPAADPSYAGRSDAIDVRPVALRSPPEIEALDTPGGTSTVINLSDDDGHTTMIWVTPADTVEGI